MLAEYKLTLPPQALERADAGARAVLEKARKQVGFIPTCTPTWCIRRRIGP